MSADVVMDACFISLQWMSCFTKKGGGMKHMSCFLTAAFGGGMV